MSRNLIRTCGQLPLVSGALPRTGKLGGAIGMEDGQELTRTCVLNALAAAGQLVGLDRIVKVVTMVGFVASESGFTGQPMVINSASDLLVSVFGQKGQPARPAVGAAELPLGAPVEDELVLEYS